MSTISTHVLDTSLGRPASGVPVTLERFQDDQAGFQQIGGGTTNDDGRVACLVDQLQPGRYRLTFATASYFAARRIQGFYPRVDIVFDVTAADEHYHVPLLLSPFGFSTYRGS
jgi:5-hydroxyisourate hydrolase